MSEWNPKFQLDLDSASNKAFAKLVEDFRSWRKELSANLPPIKLQNGWTVITPELAESLLLRNVSNRDVSLGTVQYYARMMRANVWKRTGQPIILDQNGTLLDAQHRLWAGYLGGTNFETYVVVDVPPDPMIFAYIDNNKPRTSADALATAGFNGLSKPMAMVVQMAVRYEAHAYTPTDVRNPPPRMWPAEVVHYAEARPNLRNAVRLMTGEYDSATKIITHRDVAGFAAYAILDKHGEEVLGNFMEEIGTRESQDQTIAAFQKVMEKDLSAKDPMKKHQVLGVLIKCFNGWLYHTPLTIRTIALRVNETFPRFAEAQSASEPKSPQEPEDADTDVEPHTPPTAKPVGSEAPALA